jgi:nitroreductase
MGAVEEAVAGLKRPSSFLPEEVGPDEICALFGAARVAPSADNVQMWRFVSVRNPKTKTALMDALPEASRVLFGRAPVLVAALAEPWFIKGSRREQPFFMIDVPIALCHAALQAAELGLACAVEFDVNEDIVRRAVGAGADYRAVAVLAIGRDGNRT